MINFKKYKRFVRISTKKVLSNHQWSPHSIAMGMAIGLFWGIGPTFGFQLIPALLISLKFRYNKLMTILGVFASNPLTILPIYLFNFWIGSIILNHWGSTEVSEFKFFLEHLSWDAIMKLGKYNLITFFVGSYVVATVIAIIAYFVTKKIVIKARTE